MAKALKNKLHRRLIYIAVSACALVGVCLFISRHSTQSPTNCRLFSTIAHDDIHCIALSRNGDRIAIGSGNGTVTLYDCKNGSIQKTIRPEPDYSWVNFVVFVEDVLVMGIGTRIYSWSKDEGIQRIGEAHAGVRCMAYSEELKLGAVGLHNGGLLILEELSRSKIRSVKNVTPSAIRQVVWELQNKSVICLDHDGNVIRVGFENPDDRETLMAPLTTQNTCICYSNGQVACITDNQPPSFLRKKSIQASHFKHSISVTALAYCNAEKLFISADENGAIAMWNDVDFQLTTSMKTGRPLFYLSCSEEMPIFAAGSSSKVFLFNFD